MGLRLPLLLPVLGLLPGLELGLGLRLPLLLPGLEQGLGLQTPFKLLKRLGLAGVPCMKPNSGGSLVSVARAR